MNRNRMETDILSYYLRWTGMEMAVYYTGRTSTDGGSKATAVLSPPEEQIYRRINQGRSHGERERTAIAKAWASALKGARLRIQYRRQCKAVNPIRHSGTEVMVSSKRMLTNVWAVGLHFLRGKWGIRQDDIEKQTKVVKLNGWGGVSGWGREAVTEEVRVPPGDTWCGEEIRL